MAKSLFCSGKPQNHVDENRRSVWHHVVQEISESFMKFCSAVLEELRNRDWEGPMDGRTDGRMDRRTDGQTNERTDGHTDHYIPPQLGCRGGGGGKKNF